MALWVTLFGLPRHRAAAPISPRSYTERRAPPPQLSTADVFLVSLTLSLRLAISIDRGEQYTFEHGQEDCSCSLDQQHQRHGGGFAADKDSTADGVEAENERAR